MYRSTLMPELLDDNKFLKGVLTCVRVSSTFNDSITNTIDFIPSKDGVNVKIVSTTKRKPGLNAIGVSKRWGISMESAAATIDASTQTDLRYICSPLERKVRKKCPWLEFPSIRGNMHVDSLFSEIRNIGDLKSCSVYINGLGYDCFYPWKRKGEHRDTLMRFIHDAGCSSHAHFGHC
jgi:hypothetical protein